MKNEEKPEKKTYQLILTRSLIYFLIMLSLSYLIVLGFSHILQNRMISEYELKSMTQLEYQRDMIQNHFQSVRSDLLFLPRLNETLQFKEEGSEELRQAMARDFLEFNRCKQVYDQIRYLDRSGKELVRINYNSGDPEIVKNEDLQNKGDRYYFIESISLPEEEVYVSPLDLNKEHGQLEFPLKPMIRFGTPVYDSSRNVQGVVVLNYLGDAVLRDLREADENYPGTFQLLNMEGYWLFSDDAEDEWGFMYADRQNFTLSVRHPELWTRISSSIQNQFLYEDALYTSLVVTPFPDVNENNRERSWILVNRISYDEMGIRGGFILGDLFHILVIIAVICALVAGILGKMVVNNTLYRKALKKSALYDELTGLPNRKLLEERSLQVMDQARRYSRKFALIFIDLDGFKGVNDSLGHDAGDELLWQVGERMVHCVRSIDTVARFGGDEFIILLSQIEHDEDCALVGRKLLDTLSSEFLLTLGFVSIGASLGIVIGHPDGVDNLEGLIQKADAAMYDVKSAGKNNFKIV